MNRVIHVWAYDSFEERTRIRAASQKLEGWAPNIREFVTEQQSEIFLPAPFSPKLEPRQLGNLYEIRTYTLKPGGIPGVIGCRRALRGPRTCPQRRHLAAARRPAWCYPEAGEHAGCPGILLAAALALEPGLASPHSNGEVSPTGPGPGSPGAMLRHLSDPLSPARRHGS